MTPLSAPQVGTQNGGSAANLHQFTDFGIGFAKVQPHNNNGHNLYEPAQNILRGAEMFAAALGNAANLETGDKRIWVAYFEYNNGGVAGGTVAAIRANPNNDPNIAAGIIHTDAFFDDLGLPHP